LIVGTRVVLGVGIGLLLADKLTDKERNAAGWALVAVGGLSTIPLAMNVLGKSVTEMGMTADRVPNGHGYSRTSDGATLNALDS
jgi:hypothetical protein